jgi:nucleoside-diphosphate-sugar epimerase
MSQKISIIGGAGFVGTSLSHVLAKNNQNFEIVDLKISRDFPSNSKWGDVRDIESLRAAVTGDVVVNLAAVHRDDVINKLEYQKTNVLGADNVAKVCDEKGIRKIIFTSSVAVYGFSALETDEGGHIKPFNEYGRSKFDAENKLREWQKTGDKSLIIVRPTVIFGEGNRGNVFNLFNQIASRRFIMIGKGRNKKSIAYVKNVAAFLQSCLEFKDSYAVFNYADGPDMSMKNLVTYVRERLLGKQGTGVHIPYWFGICLGLCADFLKKLGLKNLPISAIRVRKFGASTCFVSSKELVRSFERPYTLAEGLDRTLDSEFLYPDQKREIFYSE